MIDYNNLIDKSVNTKVFYSVSAAITNNWAVWTKPKGIKFVSVLVIGGGGGGGGGGASTINRTGGGGGGSSSLSRGFFLASMIPDILYVNVGRGGAGGASGLNGTAGSNSWISIQPNTSATNVLIAANNANSGAGSANGGAGGGATTFTIQSGVLSGLGLFTSTPGVNGVASISGTNGTSITRTLPVTGGASGAGALTTVTSFTGGSINQLGDTVPFISGGGIGLPGEYGYIGGFPNELNLTKEPLMFTGGAGGGSNANGTGGRGGDGGYGCGGGGGGAGTTGSGGRGGNGGDGLVIISCI